MDENEQQVLATVATNIDWLVGSNKKIESHLQQLNNSVAKNRQNLDITMTTLYGKDSDRGLIGKVCGIDRTVKRLIIAVAVISASAGGGAYGLMEALL